LYLETQFGIFGYEIWEFDIWNPVAPTLADFQIPPACYNSAKPWSIQAFKSRKLLKQIIE
jgi:hypothetical protein